MSAQNSKTKQLNEAYSEVQFTKIKSTTKQDDDVSSDEENKVESIDSDHGHHRFHQHPQKFKFFACGRELESRSKNHQFTEQEIQKLKSVESQNYFPSCSETYKYYIHYHDVIKKKHYYKWLLMGLIGFVVGIIGYLLKSCIHTITEHKLELINEYIHQSHLNKAFGIFVGIGLCLIIFSALFVVYISPFAASSGVPAVIAYLNGIYLPKYFNIRVLLIKFVSCVLCVSSGLPVGPEGPMISMGAVVGYCTSIYNLNSNMLQLFNNSKNCRDLVSAGCASGVSSAFAAPVGGLLFAMEEVSSFWNTKLGWQIFFASMTAVFITSLFMSALGGFSKVGSFGLFDMNITSIFHTTWPIETNIFVYIFAIIIGCLGGLFGSLFTFINLKINRFRLLFNNIVGDKSKFKAKTGLLCILEVCVMIILWSVITIYVPSIFECKYIEKELHDSKTLLHLNAYNCHNERDPDEWVVYNEAASLLLVAPEHAINNLLRRQTSYLFGYGSLFLVLILYFIFAVYLAGTVIACGFVIPMIFIGALYGRIIGKIANDIFGTFVNENEYWTFLDAGVMALLGSASFFGGVSRLTISLTVIFLEMTNDTSLLLPIMATIMVAKWIGDITTHSLYHALLELKCLPFLDNNVTSKYNLELFSVKYIMKPSNVVITLNEIMKLRDLIDTINEGQHGVYPVIDEDGTFIGNILSRHLHYILLNNKENCKNVFCETEQFAKMKSRESKNQYNTKWKPDIKFEEMNLLYGNDTSHDIIKVKDDKYLDYYISLSEYVDNSSFVIYENTSISRAYILFRTMGLRHLTVINKLNKIAGIITRFDLLGINIEKSVEQYMKRHKNERDNVITPTHRFDTASIQIRKSIFHQKSFAYFD